MSDGDSIEEFRASLVELLGAPAVRIRAERAVAEPAVAEPAVEQPVVEQPVVEQTRAQPELDETFRAAIAAEVSRQLRELMDEGLREIVEAAVLDEVDAVTSLRPVPEPPLSAAKFLGLLRRSISSGLSSRARSRARSRGGGHGGVAT
jgi:hypothetical protein